MRANLTVLELLQASSGTTVGSSAIGGNAVFNSSLPVLFDEFQKAKRVSEKCTEIVDSLSDMDGASNLVSAVYDVRRKSENDLTKLRERIGRATEQSLGDADRQAYFRLDADTQDELAPLVIDDVFIRGGRQYLIEKRRGEAMAQSPQ